MRKISGIITATELYVHDYSPHKATPRFHRPLTATHHFRHLTQLVACVAVPESIPVIVLLVIDIGRRAIALSLHVVHGLACRNLVQFLDGVAPVGRNQSLVGVDDAERRGEAANHSVGSVWSTGFLVNALHKNIIIWGRLRELQDDLVCPLLYVVCENLVSGGTPPVRHDLDATIELLPELERNWRDFDVSDPVPGDKCIVQLLGRVERREELRLR